METTIKGGNLMVFVNSESIPLATNHTLRISGDTEDVSNKDVASGKWAASEISQFSWEASTDNLYSTNGAEELFALMTAAQPVTLVMAPKTEADGTELPAGGSWTASSAAGYTGQAIITSLEITAQNGENATFSATFTGYGKLSLLNTSSH
jgi:hypothetical protein